MSVIDNPAWAFTFGPLNLIGSDADMAANSYRFWVLDEDGDLGDPEAIQQTILSWLQDGAQVAQEGYQNREMTLPIMVEGEDGVTLAYGEAALMLQTGQPNTLTYSPADPTAPRSVFGVVNSKLSPLTSASLERENMSKYVLHLTAEPFVRSATLTSVTVPAPTGTQAITSVDNGSSFSGWGASCAYVPGPSGGTLTSGTSGGKVFAQLASYSGAVGAQFYPALTRTGLSASLSSTPYLRVKVTPSMLNATSVGPIAFSVNSHPISVAVAEGDTYWLDTTSVPAIGTTLTRLDVQAGFIVSNAPAFGRIDIDDVSRSNVLGTQATGRQLSRVLSVAGSARTEANLELDDTTNALGTVLVHTMPAVVGLIQPNLRAWLSSGNTPTSDPTNVSGFTSDLGTLHTFDVPAAGLLPGGYLLLARVKHASTATQTLTWGAKARQGGADIGVGQSGSTSVALTASVWQIVTVGAMTLPPRKLGSSGMVRIELTGSSGVVLDEAWLFNVETGRLTQVECGTFSPVAGGSANRLWLDAPSLASPVPAVYLGHASDRSDTYHAGSELTALTVHEFVPGSVNIVTVTTNSTACAITLSYYQRWLTRAAA